MTQNDLAKKLVRGGMSENQAMATQERANSLLAGKPDRTKPMDKDNLLMQPTENWEKSDLRRPGSKVFSKPSPLFSQNYGRINWND